jgi:mono/diheme cytochrome c family protein
VKEATSVSLHRIQPDLRLTATVAGIVFATAACVSLLASCGTDTDTESGAASETAMSKTDAAPAASMTPVERGKYLVTIAGCNDCHTPMVMGPQGLTPDMTRMLSGHPQDMESPPPPAPSGPWIWSGTGTLTAYAGPWGISYAANLTPDDETGTGTWTEDWFIASLRTGKHWGRGRDIQPPMPWRWYSKMTDEDLKAIFAYLRTIPPIHNQVPAWVPPSGGSEGPPKGDSGKG